jgi:uncharacterized protein YlaN (UPF0358 family)
MVTSILWLLIILSGLYLLYLIVVVEGFESIPSELDTKEDSLRKEITSQVTILNENLCPIYKTVLDAKIDEYMQKQSEINDDQRKALRCKAKAIAKASMTKDTEGLLFPCPPPTDPIDIPNNIDTYIINTSIIFTLFVIKTKKTIEASLSKCTKERFEDKEDDCPSPKNVGVNNDPELQKQRIQALELKLSALKKGLNSKEYLLLLDNYKELTELKAKAESGQLTPNCSS